MKLFWNFGDATLGHLLNAFEAEFRSNPFISSLSRGQNQQNCRLRLQFTKVSGSAVRVTCLRCEVMYLPLSRVDYIPDGMVNELNCLVSCEECGKKGEREVRELRLGRVGSFLGSRFLVPWTLDPGLWTLCRRSFFLLFLLKIEF